MTLGSPQYALLHSYLRMSYIPRPQFLSLNLSCMQGLLLSHVCRVSVYMILNLIFSCQFVSYWFDYLVSQKNQRKERKLSPSSQYHVMALQFFSHTLCGTPKTLPRMWRGRKMWVIIKREKWTIKLDQWLSTFFISWHI